MPANQNKLTLIIVVIIIMCCCCICCSCIISSLILLSNSLSDTSSSDSESESESEGTPDYSSENSNGSETQESVDFGDNETSTKPPKDSSTTTSNNNNNNNTTTSKVSAYKGENYKDGLASFKPGKYDFDGKMKELENKISSFKIPKGMKVVAYKSNKYENKIDTYTKDVKSLGKYDNTISSIIVS